MHPDTDTAYRLARRLRPDLPPPPRYALQLIEALSTPHPNDPHGYAHRVAVVLAPRRVVKTTTILDLALARMRTHPGFRSSYTAQTGHDVSELFCEPGGLLDTVDAARLKHHTTSRSQGRERVSFRPPGRRPSFLSAFPPVPGKLRGRARNLVVIDEAQELDDVGPAIVADVMPTGDTLGARAQLVVSGTAGYGPGWWLDLVTAGRQGRVLLVELGTWPDDADPNDDAVLLEHHPGLRAGLTNLDALRAVRAALGPDRFAREYGNRWDSSTTTDQPIPLDQWDLGTAAAGGDILAAAFDVTPDRRYASVVAVTDLDNVTVRWRGHLDELARHLPPDVPVYALPGQAGTAADLRAAGVTVQLLTGNQYRAACQQTHDAVTEKRLHHAHQPELREAWQLAARTWHGDTWVLSARRSGGDITAAVATVIAWGATRHADALTG